MIQNHPTIKLVLSTYEILLYNNFSRNNMLVYKATNIVNGKVYIGKTTRTLGHAKARHHDRAFNVKYITYFYNALRKHGWSSFTWEILYTGKDDQDIQRKEKEYIVEYKDICYNMTDGGDGSAGIAVSDSTKLLRSNNVLGDRNPCFGKFGSEHPAYGNKHTEETRQRISNAHSDKSKSDEHKQALSKSKLQASKYSYECRLNAYTMRKEGHTYQQIADTLGISSSSVAFTIVQNFDRQYATVQTTSG